MSFSTALTVSAAITYIRQESMSNFLSIWLSSFITAWPIVFISILVIAPQINKILDKLVNQSINRDLQAQKINRLKIRSKK